VSSAPLAQRPSNKVILEITKMKDFTTYLSTAPVLALISLTVVAGLLIEINRFFPDALIFAF
jgi:photosystem I subunit IX